MKIYGLDFTSSPSNAKPLILAVCELIDNCLNVKELKPIVGNKKEPFIPFENWLKEAGPFVAGIDLPFGLPSTLIGELDWPTGWAGYVSKVNEIGKKAFESKLRNYKAGKPEGEKELRRITDKKANSKSPMKLQNPPVGKMFFEGATRLLNSSLSIPPVRTLDDECRVVVECYPALVARKWIGQKQGYKNDDKKNVLLK